MPFFSLQLSHISARPILPSFAPAVTMSLIIRPSEALPCSALLVSIFAIAYIWHSFTSLPMVNLGYGCYRASTLRVRRLPSALKPHNLANLQAHTGTYSKLQVTTNS